MYMVGKWCKVVSKLYCVKFRSSTNLCRWSKGRKTQWWPEMTLWPWPCFVGVHHHSGCDCNVIRTCNIKEHKDSNDIQWYHRCWFMWALMLILLNSAIIRFPGLPGYHMDLGQKAMKKPASKVAVKPVAKNRRDPNGSKWRILGFIWGEYDGNMSFMLMDVPTSCQDVPV